MSKNPLAVFHRVCHVNVEFECQEIPAPGACVNLPLWWFLVRDERAKGMFVGNCFYLGVCVCVFKGPLILFPRPPGDVSTRRSQHETEFRPSSSWNPSATGMQCYEQLTPGLNGTTENSSVRNSPLTFESSAINTERCAGETTTTMWYPLRG